MAEIRRDPVSGRWVIIATERAARPRDFFAERDERRGGFCPFCEGNEDRTPPEIAAVRPAGSEPDGPGWRVRVVANKFPALQEGSALEFARRGVYQSVPGFGFHEVVIESPRHVISPTELSTEAVADVLRIYCARARALGEHERLCYVLVFKNVGRAAGASIEHSHSQIIAVPVMPRRVHEEMQHCASHYAEASRCLLCEIAERELAEGSRVALETDNFVALSPFAARFPFEMWLMPKEHAAQFAELPEERCAELAAALREALARMEICLHDPPYNLAIHTAPVGGGDVAYYHWHLELIPRVTEVAGFEWGTGFYINPIAPEEATRYLREVAPQALRKKLGETCAAEKRGT